MHSRTQPDEEILKYSSEELMSTAESPVYISELPKSKQKPQSKESRETVITETSGRSSKRKTHSPQSMKPVKVPSYLSKSQKPPSDIATEQEKIIKLQENFIINLKNEVEVLQSEKKLLENEAGIVKSLKTATLKQEKKILSIKEAYKRDLKLARQNLKTNEDLIQDLKNEFNSKLKTKNERIEKLERKLADLKENSREIQKKIQELDELKGEYDKQRREKKRLIEENSELNEQLRLKSEENRILIQNYQEVQNQFHSLEKKHNFLKTLNIKTTNTQYELTNLISQFETINKQNHVLNEKLKFLSEKTLLVESENSDLKSALLRAARLVTSLQKKLKLPSENNQSLSQTQRFHTMLTTETLPSPKFSCDAAEISDPGCSLVETQMSQIEYELNSIKKLNKQLTIKEKELNNKLKSSEKSKKFYQDQSLKLQSTIERMQIDCSIPD